MTGGNTIQTVAVTGATGFVGRHVVREVLERGCRVRALVREKSRIDSGIPSEGVTRIFGDVLDAQAMDHLCTGADAVIHCIGIRRELPPDVTFRRLHPLAARSAIAAAVRAGVSRFTLISALGTRVGAPSAYHQSKLESEQLLRESGLDWTIFRPSLIHGPDGEMIGMIRDWVLGRQPPRTFMPYFARVEFDRTMPPKPPRLVSALIQPVYVGDVARAVAASLFDPRAIGEVYHLAGPHSLTWPEMLTMVRDAMPITDSTKKPRPIPAPLAVAIAQAAKFVGLGAALPFGPSEPIMASEDNTAPHDKARAHLGFSPAPFQQSLASYASQL